MIKHHLKDIPQGSSLFRYHREGEYLITKEESYSGKAQDGTAQGGMASRLFSLDLCYNAKPHQRSNEEPV